MLQENVTNVRVVKVNVMLTVFPLTKPHVWASGAQPLTFTEFTLQSFEPVKKLMQIFQPVKSQRHRWISPDLPQSTN